MSREDFLTLGANPDWVFEKGAVRELMRRLEFDPALVEALSESAEELGADPLARYSFLHCYVNWFERVPPETDPELSPGRNALAAVSAFPLVMRDHRARGLPWEVTAATLRDLQRWIFDHRIRAGGWGMTNLRWMRNHVKGNLYEIGRLQFSPSRWTFPFTVYHDGLALANAGLSCTVDGWIEKGASGFVTRRDGKSGHPADPHSGAIDRSPVTLPADAIPRIVRDAPTLNVHIPTGAHLRPEDCLSSLEAAAEFFRRHFPGLRPQAFCCASWLLDRELEKVLPPHSNILAFARLFTPLALPEADDTELVRLVLESPAKGSGTSLQEAVRKHRELGGRFRSAAGYILPLPNQRTHKS